MKIEIDLNDVFRDEIAGEETLEESVRRQVIDRLSGDMRKRLFARLDEEVAKEMNAQLGAAMKEKMPELLDDILNFSYTPVSSYGQKGEPTTFKEQLIKSVATNMVYAPKQYKSEENAFTTAVRSVIEAQTTAVREALVKEVNENFKKDALQYAVKLLSEKLGIAK